MVLVYRVCAMGRRIVSGIPYVSVMRNDAEWGDVVINEVMADPDPGAGEFLGEYVELFNRSDYPVQLEGWRLRCGGTGK